MLKRILMTAASAALLAGVAVGASAPAQAQVGIEIGPGGARIHDGYRPVIERREVRRERRVIVEDDDEECRTVVRRRTNQFGERVTTRTRVCD